MHSTHFETQFTGFKEYICILGSFLLLKLNHRHLSYSKTVSIHINYVSTTEVHVARRMQSWPELKYASSVCLHAKMLKYDDKPSLLYLRKVIQIKDWITARPHWPHCDQSLIHWSMNLMTSAIIKSRGWFVCWLVWVHLEEDRDVLSLAIVACLFCPASQRHRCVHKQMSQVLINPEFCFCQEALTTS